MICGGGGALWGEAGGERGKKKRAGVDKKMREGGEKKREQGEWGGRGRSSGVPSFFKKKLSESLADIACTIFATKDRNYITIPAYDR